MQTNLLLKHVFILLLIFVEISWIKPSNAYRCEGLKLKQTSCLFNDTVVENKILEKLFNLPEVKMSNRFIDSITNHRHGISMRIVQRPDKSNRYFLVDAGYDNGERFENYYNFYVLPEKMIIKVLDSDT